MHHDRHICIDNIPFPCMHSFDSSISPQKRAYSQSLTKLPYTWTFDSADLLKELGNICMKAQPPDYSKAILLYTEALAVDENNHLVLGNRSLANYKLGKFEDALTDAERAVCIAPKWAIDKRLCNLVSIIYEWTKGYLRKCAALDSLKRYEEVFEVAQNRFQLMHSPVSGVCFPVDQGLPFKFSQFNCEVPVPTGGLILSPLYFSGPL